MDTSPAAPTAVPLRERPRWLLPVCWTMLALGLACAVWSAGQRIAADRAYRDVVVLVDWLELNGLPEPGGDGQLTDLRSRQAMWALVDELPGAYVCYGEETVGALVESGILVPAGVLGTAPTFEVALPQYADDVARGALRHGYSIQRDGATGGRLIVQFPALPEIDLALLPVCWREDVVGLIRSRGVPLVLRPGGTEFMGADGVRQTLAYCRDQPLLLFQGPQVAGFPAGLDAVAEQLRAQGQRFAWVEFDEQDGGGSLARKMGPDGLVRLHSIPAEEMVNYNPDSAVERFMRALRERSIRVLYLRPFIRGRVLGGGEAYADQLAQLNRGYFAGLKTALEAEGFSIAPAAATPPDGPGRWLRLPVMLGVTGGLLLLLTLWFPGVPGRWWPWVIGLSLLGCCAGAASSSAYSAGLLKGAVAFPLLGLWLGWALYQRMAHRLPGWHPLRLVWALAALLCASLLSAAGGLLIHGGMWSSGAILKLSEFRGVNLALALPVVLLAAYAWQGETLQDSWDSARRALAPYWQRFLALWLSPIRYGDVAFILIALGALGIVVLRSGNDGPLGPLDLEMLFRSGLEDIFSVRPRTKELLGHPLLVLFFLSLAWRTRASVMLGLAGLLGQVSILNTFCHLHTPLSLTLERVTLGLLLGLASGALWGAVALALRAGWDWLAPRLRPPAESG